MFTLTLVDITCYTMEIQGRKKPWHQARREASHWNQKGAFMKPMKKPIRLLGMVFQIDK